MSLTLDPGSRFQNTPIVMVDAPDGSKVETFGIWVRPDFLRLQLADSKIGKYRVTAAFAGWPSKISLDLYGTVLYDWVLIAFNNAYDDINWPVAGDIIKYPLPSVVFSEIG